MDGDIVGGCSSGFLAFTVEVDCCGIGGLEWVRVREVLERLAEGSGVDLFVYSLEP